MSSFSIIYYLLHVIYFLSWFCTSLCSFFSVDVLALSHIVLIFYFFFNYTPTTEIYTYLHPLSLHAALPIRQPTGPQHETHPPRRQVTHPAPARRDRLRCAGGAVGRRTARRCPRRGIPRRAGAPRGADLRRLHRLRQQRRQAA